MPTRQNILFWGTTLLVLTAANLLIVKKENTLAHGRTMLLRLAPVDPRSLIQGDYMVLRYAIARNISTSNLKAKGCIVVSLDDNNVAEFVRVHQGENLQQNEYLLFYRNRKEPRLGAESFFFQEGDADLYSNARYGELKVDASGKCVLIGLRGEDFESLGKTMKNNPKPTWHFNPGAFKSKNDKLICLWKTMTYDFGKIRSKPKKG